jgi:hypothetical protein
MYLDFYLFGWAKIAIIPIKSKEKPKYFKKGLAHGFIYYLCSKIKST